MKYVKTLFSYIKEAAISGKNPDDMGLPYANTLASNVNVKETPSGSNKSTEIDRYFDLVGLDNRAQYKKTQYNKKTGKSFHRGYPWCAAFVYTMFDDFCKKIGVANPVVKTARVASLWSKADSSLKISIGSARKDPSLVKPGQIFIMLYGGGKGHTGIVTAVDTEAGTFNTIEGNTNDSKSREGHRVGRNTRKLSSSKLVGFIDYFKGNRSEKFETTLAKVVANAPTNYSKDTSISEPNSSITKDKIIIAQTKFKELGYDLGTFGPNKDGIDGAIGTKTNAAALKYQEKNGLNKTGLLDDMTMSKIMGSSVSSPIVADKILDTNDILETSNCTISIPLNVDGPVPTFIFYPGIAVGGKTGKSYMPPLIEGAVSDWYDKYIIVIPNVHTVKYDNVLSETKTAIAQLNPYVTLGSINIGIFSGSGSNGADIANRIISIRPLNLILMDPTPGSSLTKGLTSATNVYLMYNPSNWGNATFYTNGIGALEDAVGNTGGALDKVTTSHMKIPYNMLAKYRGNIKSTLTEPKAKLPVETLPSVNTKPNTPVNRAPYVQHFTDFR